MCVWALRSFSFFAAAAAAAVTWFTSLSSTHSFPSDGFSSRARAMYFFLVSRFGSFFCRFFHSSSSGRFRSGIGVVVVLLSTSVHGTYTQRTCSLMLWARIYVRGGIRTGYTKPQQQHHVFTGWAWPFWELWTVIGKLIYILYVYCERVRCVRYAVRCI